MLGLKLIHAVKSELRQQLFLSGLQASVITFERSQG